MADGRKDTQTKAGRAAVVLASAAQHGDRIVRIARHGAFSIQSQHPDAVARRAVVLLAFLPEIASLGVTGRTRKLRL